VTAPVVASAIAATAGCGSSSSNGGTPSGQMILATTTSTRDIGLLDTLVPAFQRASKCSAKTVAIGSGQAIDLGARGQADVLLVHSPDAEQAFMQQGHGASRLAVMHNDLCWSARPAIPPRPPAPAGSYPR
jgi:tungstate transport system substrate-binding protein